VGLTVLVPPARRDGHGDRHSNAWLAVTAMLRLSSTMSWVRSGRRCPSSSSPELHRTFSFRAGCSRFAQRLAALLSIIRASPDQPGIAYLLTHDECNGTL
jgi:hypothetical protein